MSEKSSFEFQADVKELLNLVTHSLYSNREIFLRELISNASDAIDKIRFEALTKPELLEEKSQEYKISIIPNAEAKTLTITDNGCGMDEQELREHLGTIARSGTKTFLQQLKGTQELSSMDFIGQFGVGFYSAFIVSDRVVVKTRKAQTRGCQWASQGQGNFEIEPTGKFARGTEVILYLKEDALNFLEEFTLRGVVKKYSDFIEHPIALVTKKDGKETEEVLNSRKAIWLKSPSEIEAKEYHEFYKHLSHDFQDPLRVIHYRGEGTLEFKALIYISAHAPLDLYSPEFNSGLQLYINRVFIMEDCKKLIPPYLRFLKGVVDCGDLTLNVSREMIQEDPRLEKIKKNLVRKVLGNLAEWMEQNRKEYEQFYAQFGKVLKEGLHFDSEQRDKIADLLLFETTQTETGQYKSLKQYLEGMKPTQKEIYYLIAENRTKALATPQLEAFKAKEVEVLLMMDPVDQWVMGSLTNYQEKPIKSISHEAIDLHTEEEKKSVEENLKEQGKKYKDLLKAIGEKLEAQVKEVRFSPRLTDSVCCLVAETGTLTPQMEQMLKSLGQAVPVQKKILEINPNHPLLEVLQRLYESDHTSAQFADYVQLLLDQALLTEGAELTNPKGLSKRISDLMVRAATTPGNL
ncbi:MAG: molecular chaperone HtpG [Deltaproteobacteria bacterium]|nr:molecular chaperone HtpG [Deltaproteobacteria bacterium]